MDECKPLAHGLPLAKLADLGVARRMRLGAEHADAATATELIGTDGYRAGAYTRSLFSSM